MSKAVRRWLLAAVTVGLAAIVIYGVAAGVSGHHDPVQSITSRLRCPVCQASSVADSPSVTAKEMRSTVQRQVHEGRSEHQILAFFRKRYGPWILLDPPRSGTTMPLWLAPPIALGAGVALIVRYRLRTTTTSDPNDSRPSESTLPSDHPRSERLVRAPMWATSALQRVPWVGPGRRTIGIASLVAVAVFAGAFVSRTLVPSRSASASSRRSLDAISTTALERAVSQNPAVVAMRLALVQRHLREGDVLDARREAEASLTQATSIDDRERALKFAGWSEALLGDPGAGAKKLEQSLAIDPTDRDTNWYLANVRLVGLHQPDGAARILEDLLKTKMSHARRAAVRRRLDDARAAMAK